MNSKKAKALQKRVYGDMSIRIRNYRHKDTGQRINTGLRG